MSAENRYEQFYLDRNTFPKIPVLLPEVIATPDYVAIEGNSGAGKTTTTNIVAERTGLPHIGEYGNYVNFSGGESFPKFPSESPSDVIQTNTLWPQLEFRRRAHQIFIAQSSPETVQIVERSPVSLIAFEYAKMQQGMAFDMDHLLGLYTKLYGTGILKEPSAYVYIKASPESVEKRVTNRSGNPTLEFLYKPQTVNAINEFIEKFLIRYIEPDKYIILNSDSDNQDCVATKIIDFIDKLSGKLKSTNGISKLAYNSLTGQPLF